MGAKHRIDMTGQTFGALTVVRYSHTNLRGRSVWVCQCSCGIECQSIGPALRRGLKRSCGASIHRSRDKKPRSEWLSQTPTYLSWIRLRARCNDPKNQKYPKYGGRGIKVCDRWQSSFSNFLADMGERPGREFTIERKEVDGDYEPENCIWLPAKDQGRNKTCSVYVEYEGHEVLLLDLCAELGLDRNRTYQRLKLGWPLEKAISSPVRKTAKYRKSPKNSASASAVIDNADTALTSPDQETIST